MGQAFAGMVSHRWLIINFLNSAPLYTGRNNMHFILNLENCLASPTYPPDGIWKTFLADGKVEVQELKALENKINEDGKVSRDEMREFGDLLGRSKGEAGQTRFTAEALVYIDKHFSCVKEKAENEYTATNWLIYGGGAVLATGLFSRSPFGMGVSVIGGISILTGAIVSGDGSAFVANQFDSQGRLMVI
jgi:hypothetical protein